MVLEPFQGKCTHYHIVNICILLAKIFLNQNWGCHRVTENTIRHTSIIQGVRCSSVVKAFAHGAIGHWIDPSWGEPIELFLIPASAGNTGCGMCYPVCVMVHIKELLLLIEKSSPCGGSGYPLSLSAWSSTI